MFFRRSAYISTDGYSLVYRNSKHRSTDGNARASNAYNAKDAERRIPLASITSIALESELYLEFSGPHADSSPPPSPPPAPTPSPPPPLTPSPPQPLHPSAPHPLNPSILTPQPSTLNSSPLNPSTPHPLAFAVDSTIRGKKFLFRCSSRQDLQMWLNGLAELTP